MSHKSARSKRHSHLCTQNSRFVIHVRGAATSYDQIDRCTCEDVVAVHRSLVNFRYWDARER